MSRTTYWVSEGVPVSVTTTRQAGESLAAFRQRHEDAVVAAMTNFPDDAGSMTRCSIWTSAGLPRSSFTTRSSSQSYATLKANHDARQDADLGDYPADPVTAD